MFFEEVFVNCKSNAFILQYLSYYNPITWLLPLKSFDIVCRYLCIFDEMGDFAICNSALLCLDCVFLDLKTGKGCEILEAIKV